MKKVEKEKLNSFNYETKQRDLKQKEEKTCILSCVYGNSSVKIWPCIYKFHYKTVKHWLRMQFQGIPAEDTT